MKDYTREETAPAPATSLLPLNRVVDAVRPESATARQFADAVNELVGDAAKPGSEARMKDILKRWRDNQAELQPQVEKSLLLKEVAPLSQNLSALGAAGLAALYYIDRGQAAPPEWVTQQIGCVEQAEEGAGPAADHGDSVGREVDSGQRRARSALPRRQNRSTLRFWEVGMDTKNSVTQKSL